MTLTELRHARDLAALIALADAAAAPIFDRLDREVAALEVQDPLERARAVVAQRRAG